MSYRICAQIQQPSTCTGCKNGRLTGTALRGGQGVGMFSLIVGKICSGKEAQFRSNEGHGVKVQAPL